MRPRQPAERRSERMKMNFSGFKIKVLNKRLKPYRKMYSLVNLQYHFGHSSESNCVFES